MRTSGSTSAVSFSQVGQNTKRQREKEGQRARKVEKFYVPIVSYAGTLITFVNLIVVS